MSNPSFRAQLVTRRTYNRPLDEEGKTFETWEQTVDRVIGHQRWLWERAQGFPLKANQLEELEELRSLMLDRKVSLSGRTLWLGGTDIAKTREASQFNCSHVCVETVYDFVDMFWLLLQGCGVGFTPVRGTLSGFMRHIPEVDIIRSERTDKGRPTNKETFRDGVWTIQIGDSAEAWAKSLGKILAGKYPAQKLVIDLTEIRPAGKRLKGYGWICSGDGQLAAAYDRIIQLMNQRAGQLLSIIDILDIGNLIGTVLSSRRSAEIALVDYDDPEWKEFALAKKDCWDHDRGHREQSNNSLVFRQKPSFEELWEIFDLMMEGGGSEPGFINAEAALKRAPWFKGVNPCAEILLGNKSFCNLVEIDTAKFEDGYELAVAIQIAARANYRQTCVDLRDGVLQEAWHLNNKFLRLCGVGLTGVVKSKLSDSQLQGLREIATQAAYGMADELGMERPKNVTTVKPSGTLSKVMDTTEGVHRPIGKYIFNNIGFSVHDPLVEKAKASNYRVTPKPGDPSSVLITLPVAFEDVEFDIDEKGVEVNRESAIDQLNRYLQYQTHWTQQNTSVTIYYDPSEVPKIIQWLRKNWDNYVGVSFLYRPDASKTAKDLGYPYLPQEVVTEEAYRNYVEQLLPIDLEETNTLDELEDEGCVNGVCPVR